MTAPSDHSVALLLEGIAAEINSVTELLLDVEESDGRRFAKGNLLSAQKFDLSLQILSDLARIARRLSEGLPEARIPTSLVRNGDLLLERTRSRLLQARESSGPIPTQSVELF
jgi:hypothetical protein